MALIRRTVRVKGFNWNELTSKGLTYNPGNKSKASPTNGRWTDLRSKGSDTRRTG